MYSTIMCKRCAVGITRKSHFRLVPKSVTLNDLERRNGHYLRYFAELAKLSWLIV